MVLEWDAPVSVRDFKMERENVIETTRLLMRLPEATDAQALMEIHQDPEVLAQGLVTLTAPPGGIDVALRNVDRMLRHWKRYG